MSIQLRYKEDFSEGLKRLMVEECETALKYLRKSDTEEEQHKAVHESRKAFKKIRACLRLVRDHIDFYDRENKWFRDLGRKVSDVRDLTAHLETLEVLETQYESQLYKKSFQDLEKGIHASRDQLAEKVFGEDNRLEEIQQKVEAKIDEIPDWSIDVQQFKDIRPSLKRTYKRGYKGLKNVAKTGEVEDFHDWRKRVKYLRYHIDILNRLWPQVMDVLEEELHDITDYTGTLHDLHNLKILAQELEKPFSDTEERMLFEAMLEKHQDFMRKHTLLKAQKFYYDSPSDFCDRIKLWWKAHQQEVENSSLPRTEELETT
ncbi:CHAD domain-containing protein [Fodinibius salsisoli]|uniref:CHAD domain-containing protein n=1 Tax=Fodinibius salsisoli TaxID=2820877 RepID=A0ABT3PJK4_9BACT|nr:CHAD domain-containing protein [Fodinibius salsisoli]MCW9705943.1 CHAD domain-containing protein [Fodinibius salsisoli]